MSTLETLCANVLASDTKKYFHDPINVQHYPDAAELPLNPSLLDLQSKLSMFPSLEGFARAMNDTFDQLTSFYQYRNPHLSQTAKKCKETFAADYKNAQKQLQLQLQQSNERSNTPNFDNRRDASGDQSQTPPKKKFKSGTPGKVQTTLTGEVVGSHTDANSPVPDAAEKAARGLALLSEYLVQCGLEPGRLKDWYVTIEARKEGKTQGSSDMYYFSPNHKKFRSRAEVARHFGLAAAPPKRTGGAPKKRRPTHEIERRRLQKEIDKLLSATARAQNKLTEVQGELNKREAPLPDSALLASGATGPLELPKADGSGLPGLPASAIPSVLQVHDFLTRFSNTLLLAPCPLDDFATALRCSDENQPPYVSEAIMAMLKLLLSDPFSKEFWKADGRFTPRQKADGTNDSQMTEKAPDPNDTQMVDAPSAAPGAVAEVRYDSRRLKDDDNDSVITADTEDDENDSSPGSYIDAYFSSSLPPTRTTLCCVLLDNSSPPDASEVTALNYHNHLGIVCDMLLRHYKLTLLRSDASVRANRALPRLTPAEIGSRAEAAAAVMFGATIAAGLKAAVQGMGDMSATFAGLPLAGKVGVLKLLVEACYDTARVRGVVEDNAAGRWQAEQRVEVDRKNKRRDERTRRKEWEEKARQLVKARVEEKVRKEFEAEIKTKRAEAEGGGAEGDELTAEEKKQLEERLSAVSPPKKDVDEEAKRLREVDLLGFDASVQIIDSAGCAEMDDKKLRLLLAEANGKDLSDLEGQGSWVYEVGLSRAEISQLRDLRERIADAEEAKLKFPTERVDAIKALAEAAEGGSMKDIKRAVKEAKAVALTGQIPGGGGSYVHTAVRDAVLTLREAENRKRQIDAEKALVEEREKCFVRTDRVGGDRMGRTYWEFMGGEGIVWVKEAGEGEGRDAPFERDVTEGRGEEAASFGNFVRQESGRTEEGAGGSPQSWTWYANETELRSIMRKMEERGRDERKLKEGLREVLDRKARAVEEGDEGDKEVEWKTSGGDAKLAMPDGSLGETLVGERVRREIKGRHVSRRLNGFVVSWAMLKQTVEGGEVEREVEVPFWRIAYDEGGEEELPASEVVGAVLCSRAFLKGDKIEEGSDIWSYHNALGRFTGAKRGDGLEAVSPRTLGRDLRKREIEMNSTLKALIEKGGVVDGDKTDWRSSGRDAWIQEFSASLREEERPLTFDYVKGRLLALEVALNALHGVGEAEKLEGAVDYASEALWSTYDVKKMTYSENADKLWASPRSRGLFIKLVNEASSVPLLYALVRGLQHNLKTSHDVYVRGTRPPPGVLPYVNPQDVPECGECKYCLDKPKWGGGNTLRRACINRQEAQRAMQAAWDGDMG